MAQEPVDQKEQVAEQGGGAKLVPVGESIKYRRRAQQAEIRVQEMEQKLNDLQTQLDRRTEELAAAESQRDEATSQLISSENRLVIERLLNEAGVIDLETASLLLSKKMV